MEDTKKISKEPEKGDEQSVFGGLLNGVDTAIIVKKLLDPKPLPLRNDEDSEFGSSNDEGNIALA